MTTPTIIHHGGADGVTGSCHRLMATEHHHILVDCGIFQGEDAGEDSLAQHEVKFDLSAVKALVVTHVHIDHIGRLPYLLAAGFTGPIICSKPSALLLPLVIEDALKVGFTRNARLIDQVKAQMQRQIVAVAYNEWHTVVDDPEVNLQVRLQRAGHILGSAYVEVDVLVPAAQASRHGVVTPAESSAPGQSVAGSDSVGGEPSPRQLVPAEPESRHEVVTPAESSEARSHRTVFSGDLGAPHAPLLPAPVSPARSDTLVIESTYGNRVHENRETRKARLRQAIELALENGGTVMIPAFSIGRTQEILYELEEIMAAVGGTLGPDQNVAMTDDIALEALSRPSAAPTGQGLNCLRNLEIIVDSPLAARFTEVYRQLKPYWDDEAQERLRAGRHPLSFEQLYTVDGHEEHMQTVKYLANNRRPAVVIAASGMVAGGRIMNYMKAILGDPAHAVLFVGYQAAGTPGAAIQRYGRALGEHLKPSNRPEPWVDIDGQRYPIRAGVMSIGGYSAHAGQDDLVNFIRDMIQWPQEVRMVHGNQHAREALRDQLLALGAEAGHAFDVVLPARTP